MGRRDELEKELALTHKLIKDAPKDIPRDLLDGYHKQLDSISFELNNLYDDPETESE